MKLEVEGRKESGCTAMLPPDKAWDYIAGLHHNWNLRDDVDGLTISNYRCKPAVPKEMQKLIFYFHRDIL